MSPSIERGCFSGKAATPTQKSPDALSSVDQLGGVLQALGVGQPVGLRVARRVAAQRQHVAHAGLGVLPDDVAQLGDRVVDRGEVADRRSSVVSAAMCSVMRTVLSRVEPPAP